MGVGLFSWLASSEKGEKKPHPPGAFCEKPLYLLILPEIEFIDIFLKRNYDFFHAQFLDFHGHIFFNFSRAQILVSRTQIHENFHGHFFFFHGPFPLIFFTGDSAIFTGKKTLAQKFM